MARARSATALSRARQPKKAEALGPGVHAATIELKSASHFHARTSDNRKILAVLGDGVDPGLIEECLRTGRMVLLCDTDRGPTIVGAIQTSRSPVHEANGAITLEAKDIRLRAERSIVLDAGPVSIRADKSGAIRLEGDTMVIDISALVRFLSARVELP